MRGPRVFGAVLLALTCVRAHAQVCTERAPCVNVITLPPSAASIGGHRMVAAGGALVWPGFIDVHALDLATGRARSLAHCGTVVGDVAVEGTWVYVLADHAELCRVPLATGRGVQMLVAAQGAVVDAFAVSSAAVAYSYRRRGDQPELRVMQWTGEARSFPTSVTVEHVAVDATTIYWVEAGTLLRASIATGAKTVGPTIAHDVRRLAVNRGVVYVATDQDVLRLDASHRTWTTLASEGADDLVASGSSVYWTTAARGTVTKLGVPWPRFPVRQPRALALEGTSLFVAADDPLVIDQIVPR